MTWLLLVVSFHNGQFVDVQSHEIARGKSCVETGLALIELHEKMDFAARGWAYNIACVSKDSKGHINYVMVNKGAVS